MVGVYGLLHPGELAMSEHVILAENVHIGTNKAIIILSTSKLIAHTQHSTLYFPLKALHGQSKL